MASLSPRPIERPQVSNPKQTVAVSRQVHAIPSPISSQEKVKWLFTVLICSLIAMFIVSQYSRIAQDNLAIEKEKLAIQNLTTDNAKLKDQAAMLQSPAYVLKIARDKLHMIPAGDQPVKGNTP